ncbi:AAA family ATPase [Microtetraspora sp. AC03309]|uniref:BTAD domain-containing putative transcriptional regulator n=1 Tax=Microtetraspora sp. AC03309 TaxID=2779376 RepID=UPI001E5C3139|nr:BTAD domain-containing putative transcriptional regulator [Microtetraspora sp. AC03309]MCC5576712.1 AAA family ATPase [Microtetraspora sp. AC03309]
MQFGILGPLAIRTAEGESISVGGLRPRALLALLLLDAGRPVGVERLIDGQYGDDPPAGAAGAIQAHVSRLRRSLPADLIEFNGAGYRLAVDPDDVDVHRFERLAREGHRLLAAGHHERAARSLRDALGLWHGPALADVADAPFAPPQVTRLEEVRLAAREDLVEAELALPEGTSTAELRQLVAANPLRERLRGQLMRALHASGQQAAALAVFDEARRLLAEELGADPSPELAALHLAILRGDEPRERATGRRLPAQLTSFVGRAAELDRIDSLRDSRLITLTGPGGTGKTRLAIEAARRRGRDTCFVDLSPLDDGGQVPQAVLGALGLRETGLRSLDLDRSDPTDRIAAALADHELLLILDNCEHVIASAAVLVRRLLDACPGLAVLATSREPLGLTGETLVPLVPLAVPPPGTDLDEAAGYPAVQLFADRAAAVRPGFAMRPEVVEICATLEGLPLAIELAAARVRSFTAPEIASRLKEHGRFALLSRGDRTAAVRHQTLYAVVEWSWSLLSPDEREMARRFSVFSGGASIEAVERVCGPGEVLADLVDKSLVEASDGRYRMFDTIRLFCAERLAEAGEEERLRDAHAAYFLDLAQRADPWLRRAEQLDWLARLAVEHSNFGAALRHAVQTDPETALRLIAALSAYWWLSGRRGQAASSALSLLGSLGTEAPVRMEEEYVLCVLQAVPDASPAQWARAEEIMRSLDRELRHPFAAVMWGMVAGPPARDSARTRQFGSDPWSRAMVSLGRGMLNLLDGRVADAERELTETLESFRVVGERWGMAQGFEWLGTIANWRGDWARARWLWGQALDLQEQLGALDEMVDVLCRRASGLLREGDFPAVDADLRRAAELERRTGRSHRPALIALGRGELARVQGDHSEARAQYTEALSIVSPGTYVGESVRLQVLSALGRLAEAGGDLAEAGLRHGEALALAHAVPAADLADVAEGQAGLALLDGRAERAAFLLGVGVALRGMAVVGDRDVAGVAAGATEAVGAERFAAAFARGAALDRDRALTALS